MKQPRVKRCLLGVPKHYHVKHCLFSNILFCFLSLCVFTASISAWQSFCHAVLTTWVKWWWIVKPLVHRVGYSIPCGVSWPRLCPYLRGQQYAQRRKEDSGKTGWSRQNYEEELLFPLLYSYWKKNPDVSDGNSRLKIKDWFHWRSSEGCAEQPVYRWGGEESLSRSLRAHASRSSLAPRRKGEHVMNIYWPSEAGYCTTFC